MEGERPAGMAHARSPALPIAWLASKPSRPPPPHFIYVRPLFGVLVMQ